MDRVVRSVMEAGRLAVPGLLVLLWLGAPTSAAAQTVAHTGSPTLTISAVNAPGGSLLSDVDATTTLSFTANAGGRLTAQLSQSLPAGMTLTVAVAEPPGAGTSQGPVTLSTAAADVVVGIAASESATNLTLTYELSATVAVPPQTVTPQVLFTLVEP